MASLGILLPVYAGVGSFPGYMPVYPRCGTVLSTRYIWCNSSVVRLIDQERRLGPERRLPSQGEKESREVERSLKES